ncbi:Transcription termination factor MTERF9 chloroplastic [Bienertia sinuspersici]
MLRFKSNCNGVQDLIFIHGFRQLVLYSTSISTELNPNLVNYLVENLGFSKQQALSTSTKFSHNRLGRGAKKVSDSNFINNADSVVTFLKKIGLEQCHIRNAIGFDPQILLCNVDKTLIPKTEVLQKSGFSESDIAEVVSVNPSIYLMGLNSSIIPAIQALREIMGCERHVISILKKSRRMRLSAIPTCLVPNVALLQSYGIPIASIRKFLLREPFSFLRKTESFQDAVMRAEENLGIPRNSAQFLIGVVILTSYTEKTIEAKKQVYKSFGWTDSDVATLVMLSPPLLGLSEDSIKKKLDFLMNEVGYEPSYLASRCCLFTCSLEKRVVPRHKVLLVLKEKGLIRKDYALATALFYTESKFLKKFVLPFKGVHEVYCKHADVSLEMLTLGSSKPDFKAV